MKKIIKGYDFELEEKDFNLIRKNAEKLLRLALVNECEDFYGYYVNYGLTNEVKEILPFLEEIEDIEDDEDAFDSIMNDICDTISGEISPEDITFSHSDFSDYNTLKNVIADRYDCVESVIDALTHNKPLFNQVVDYLLGDGTLKNEKLDLE